MNPVVSHFTGLSIKQMEQLEKLEGLYRGWNERINVISRQDIDQLYLHHVLHSLSIGRLISFRPGTQVLDAGTGGGFPGIPLAILFPGVGFTLVDSIGKKIRVVEAIARSIGLDNIRTEAQRVERLEGSYDFVVSRAVTNSPDLYRWVIRLIRPGGFNDLPNGLIILKGGDLADELKPFGDQARTFPISAWFEESYFETKKIIYLPAGCLEKNGLVNKK